MKNFDMKKLLQTAEDRTGLSDFGQPDCMDNLDALIKSINSGAAVSPRRWDDVFEYLVRILVNRLWFAKDLKDHPEILDQELLPPVAIVSLPRTGSTKTQRLLGASDEFLNLLWWQMHMFARIPGEPDGGVAERLRVTREFEVWADQASPNLKSGHARYADQPEEEQILQEFMFAPTISVQFSGSDYTPEQLMKTQAQPIFDYMAMQLKYLQWQFHEDDPRRWLLKAPQNMAFEKELVASFGQDMKMITTHRDPLNIVPSIAKLGESFRAMFSDVQDKDSLKKLAKNMLFGFSYSINKHMAWRDENPDVEILDLSFEDINNNTLDVLKTVYDYLDIGLTDAVKDQVKAWDREQKASHRGANYSLEEFDLTEEEIYEAFKPYTDRFAQYLNI